MSGKNPDEKIWRLMSEVGTAMLVTHIEGEQLRARPMAARVEPDDNAVYFFDDAEAPKEREITHESHVCLAFSDTKTMRYVSVSGIAEVFSDKALAERLWNAADKAYFTDAADPRLRIIRVTPDRGEFWEGSGLVSTLASLLTAGARRERPKLGENAKVSM